MQCIFSCLYGWNINSRWTYMDEIRIRSTTAHSERIGLLNRSNRHLPYGPIFGHHIPKVQIVPRTETVKETVDPLQTEIIKRFKLKARKIADFEGFLHHINIFSQVKIPGCRLYCPAKLLPKKE